MLLFVTVYGIRKVVVGRAKKFFAMIVEQGLAAWCRSNSPFLFKTAGGSRLFIETSTFKHQFCLICRIEL